MLKRPTLALAALCLCVAAPRMAKADSQKSVALHEDRSFEEYLKYQGGPDEPITPGRVLRWMRGLTSSNGVSLPPPSVEFEPVVHAKNSRYQVVAAVTYKFK